MRALAFLLSILCATSGAAADIAGSYQIEGKNPGGTAYAGQLAVKRAGGAYKLTWTTGNQSVGVGIVVGDMLAAAIGTDCSLAAYRTAPEGGLIGGWTWPTGGAAGTEKAVPGVGTTQGIVGDYVVSGTNPNGRPYKGSLGIARDDGWLRFSWRTGNDVEGWGIDRSGRVAVTWGQPGCGVALYKIGTDGTLTGTWRLPGGSAGSEIAKR